MEHYRTEAELRRVEDRLRRLESRIDEQDRRLRSAEQELRDVIWRHESEKRLNRMTVNLGSIMLAGIVLAAMLAKLR